MITPEEQQRYEAAIWAAGCAYGMLRYVLDKVAPEDRSVLQARMALLEVFAYQLLPRGEPPPG